MQVQLNYKFLTRPVDFAGLHRVEKGEYPVAALREMLLNALVHRTYMGAPIQIRVFDDRLGIWNEGALPNGLNADSLKSEHPSRPRNPKIADACFKAGYIDTWGRGTLKIIQSCKEAELPEPQIIEKDGGVLVTIYKVLQSGAMGGAMEDLTVRQKEILEQIIINNKVTYRAIAKQMQINESAVLKHIDQLKEKGYLKRVGKTRGHWKIIRK